MYYLNPDLSIVILIAGQGTVLASGPKPHALNPPGLLLPYSVPVSEPLQAEAGGTMRTGGMRRGTTPSNSEQGPAMEEVVYPKYLSQSAYLQS